MNGESERRKGNGGVAALHVFRGLTLLLVGITIPLVTDYVGLRERVSNLRVQVENQSALKEDLKDLKTDLRLLRVELLEKMEKVQQAQIEALRKERAR